MTPQEHQLVADLFERLAALEKEPRDPEAERAIREGLSRAPNALYALVQTSLLQDEALRQAQAHIDELEAALSQPQQAQQQGGGGFLDSLRGAMFGGGGQPQGQGRGSVPSVRPGDSGGGDSRWGAPMGAPAGYGQGQPGYGQPGYGQGQPGYGQDPRYAQQGFGQPGAPAPGGAFGGRGGSFLGTAAAAAAGMIGGSLLMDSLRGMGHPAGGAGGGSGGSSQAALDSSGGGGGGGSPWSNASDSSMARDAGLGDIGRGGGGSGDGGANRHAALDDPGSYDQDDGDDGNDDGDYGDDGDYDTA